jgi:Fe-S oxidoreductase
MAKMKIEVLAAANKRRGLSLRDRLVAYLPRYAPYAARLAPLLNARNALPAIAALAERFTGFSARRPLPKWRGDYFRAASPSPRHAGGVSSTRRLEGRGEGRQQAPEQAAAPHPSPLPTEEWGEGIGEVALFADTFNTYFEPENLHAAAEVLSRLGYRVTILSAGSRERPLCCGRTYLSAGLVEQARAEARRVLAAAAPLLARGVAVVGLEPSCLLTLRDEFIAMLPGPEADRLASRSFLLEEFLAAEVAAGRIKGPIASRRGKVLLHGHCHQKAFAAMGAIQTALALVDGLSVETVESSCCGMAGAFGYGTDTYETSMAMGELSLLPAVRKAATEALIAADGFSCRHQIHDGTGRSALHVARILREAMGEDPDVAERR